MAGNNSIDLGKVGITPKGEYNASTTFERLDLVTYNNGSYLSLHDGNAGHSVTDTEWWLNLVSGADAVAAAKSANDASAKATSASESATKNAASANAAASSANAAAQKANSASDGAIEQTEAVKQLATQLQQAIKNAEDAYALLAESTGVDKFAGIPATICVDYPDECVVGEEVPIEVTMYPSTANKSRVFVTQNYKGEISPDGKVTSDEACVVKLNVVSTLSSHLFKTVSIKFRDPVARETEDGTARTMEDGTEITC